MIQPKHSEQNFVSAQCLLHYVFGELTASYVKYSCGLATNNSG